MVVQMCSKGLAHPTRPCVGSVTCKKFSWEYARFPPQLGQIKGLRRIPVEAGMILHCALPDPRYFGLVLSAACDGETIKQKTGEEHRRGRKLCGSREHELRTSPRLSFLTARAVLPPHPLQSFLRITGWVTTDATDAGGPTFFKLVPEARCQHWALLQTGRFFLCPKRKCSI